MGFNVRYHLCRALVTTAVLLTACSSASFAAGGGKLGIMGLPQDAQLQQFMGNAWALYLTGLIDVDAAKRLEEFITRNNVPQLSWAFLDSRGGSLYGGMALGNVIRKHRFQTDVAVRKDDPSNIFTSEPGGCYSACTLAYVGGGFRFLRAGSHFGIHRFAFSTPHDNEIDVAQVASATIVQYLRSMDIDTDLFTLSTVAGPDQIYEPPLDQLKRLNVVTDGFNKPKWSVESNNGILYLKGERDTVYGINKFLLLCEPKARIVLHIIFDPQGHTEVMNFEAHSLVVDHQEYPITSSWKEMGNGWFNSEYVLSDQQLLAIRQAKSVGLIVQASYGAPIFLGFNDMPFADGAKKLVGLLNNCSVRD